MTAMADVGARLRAFSLEHPEAAELSKLYGELAIDRPPTLVRGSGLRYRALIETPAGVRELF